MKKLRFIFIFVFLSGMIFTVFQYLPLLEEETAGNGIEISKKTQQQDSSDGDTASTDGDSNEDDDSEQEMNYCSTNTYALLNVYATSNFYIPPSFYTYHLEQKDTPPPKA
jgi:hypothetical protein